MRNPSSVLITGATGGIGAALAAAYAAPRRKLYLHGRRADRLEEIAAACRGAGSEVETKVLDVLDVEALMRWLGGLRELDLAIVNAGVTSNLADGEDWTAIDHLLQVNLRAALATVSAVLPAMRARRRGQIALVSSIAAWRGLPVTPAYCASKAALKAYGEALRGALAAHGVEVNVVMPGFVRTAMAARFRGPKLFMLTPEAAARRVVRGLERNAGRISFPWPASLFMRTLAALPDGLAQRLLRLLGYGG
jgi:short-subunit dehydrogenase